MPRRIAPTFCLMLAGLLAAGAGQAADKPKEPGFGKTKGALLSRAELRDCMARQDRIRERNDATQKAKTEFDAAQAEIARQDDALKQSLASLDRTDAAAVDAYNLKVQARDKLIDDYNARSPAFNAGIDALQAERDAFGKSCDNRRFDEKDEIAIRNGKR